jgi:dCMP deaminase
MVVTHMPCMNCAKLIVQSGIEMVVCPEPDALFEVKWASEFASARRLFKEVGVRLCSWSDVFAR